MRLLLYKQVIKISCFQKNSHRKRACILEEAYEKEYGCGGITQKTEKVMYKYRRY